MATSTEEAGYAATRKRKLVSQEERTVDASLQDTSSYMKKSLGDNDLLLGARRPETIELFHKKRPTMDESRAALQRLTGEGSLSMEEEAANTAHIKALQAERQSRLLGRKPAKKKKSKKEKKHKEKDKKKKKKKKTKKKSKRRHSDSGIGSSDSSDSSSDEEERDGDRSSSKKHSKHKKHKK